MLRVKVACIAAQDLKRAISLALDSVGQGFLSELEGHRVLIKANFNSPDSYPASTDPAFLSTLVAIFKSAGVREIIVGDSSGLRWAPTERVFSELGVRELAARMGVACVNFDNGPWRSISVNGRHFTEVRIADIAFQVDKIIYAGCMKTHHSARFSLSLKHAVGFLPPELRRQLHTGDIEEKIAELNLAVRPDLMFIDARKCFVSGGPDAGRVRHPNVVMASVDRIALDVEALKILRSFFAFNRLRKNPWKHAQIKHAISLGLGVSCESEYDVVTG